MSFRQFGGMNYAPKHNIVGSHYNTSTNLQVTEAVGQPNSYINFESDISGNVVFSGDFNLNGNLNVSGDISSGGDTNVNGDLNVTGATTLSNTLDVAGATTLSNTLNVSGQTEITNQLTVYNTSTPNSYKGAFLNSDGNPLTIGEGILLSANGSVTEIKMNNAGLSNFTINNNGSFNIVDTSNNSSPFTTGNNLLSILSSGDTTIYGKLDMNNNDITNTGKVRFSGNVLIEGTGGTYNNSIRTEIGNTGEKNMLFHTSSNEIIKSNHPRVACIKVLFDNTKWISSGYYDMAEKIIISEGTGLFSIIADIPQGIGVGNVWPVANANYTNDPLTSQVLFATCYKIENYFDSDLIYQGKRLYFMVKDRSNNFINITLSGFIDIIVQYN